jgi:hypothetical protein
MYGLQNFENKQKSTNLFVHKMGAKGIVYRTEWSGMGRGETKVKMENSKAGQRGRWNQRER